MEDLETTSETPMTDALEAAAEVHEIADEAATETIAEAVVEAEVVQNVADAGADTILSEGLAGAADLLEAGEPDAAEAVLSEAIADAAEIEEAGEEVADELLAEAAIEAVVMEETADEIGRELAGGGRGRGDRRRGGVPRDGGRAGRRGARARHDEPGRRGGRRRPEPAAVVEPDPEPVAAEVEAAPEPASDDPFRGPGEWYVVHTYAGYENKVKTNLESRIHTMQMEGKIFRVHIPMEDVMEIKGGKKQVVQKKVFPGYLLVKMDYDNDSWYVVRNTPG